MCCTKMTSFYSLNIGCCTILQCVTFNTPIHSVSECLSWYCMHPWLTFKQMNLCTMTSRNAFVSIVAESLRYFLFIDWHVMKTNKTVCQRVMDVFKNKDMQKNNIFMLFIVGSYKVLAFASYLT